MSNSAQFRSRARASLSGKYMNGVLVCLITSLVSALISLVMSNSESVFLAAAYVILSLLYSVIILMPLDVGEKRYFIELAQNKTDIANLLYPFKNSLTNVIKVTLLQSVKIVLWSLLFYIPGLIKTYEYAMIPYILAENPNIDARRAFEMSRAMMTGNKWRLFKLQFSFIGWVLLACLTAGIGMLFLMPYTLAAQTEFYFEVKEDAMRRGFISAEELPFTGRVIYRDSNGFEI